MVETIDPKTKKPRKTPIRGPVPVLLASLLALATSKGDLQVKEINIHVGQALITTPDRLINCGESSSQKPEITLACGSFSNEKAQDLSPVFDFLRKLQLHGYSQDAYENKQFGRSYRHQDSQEVILKDFIGK